jgi:D-glycero-D-manno-heptose 1,7-bisphosphate phosphatase
LSRQIVINQAVILAGGRGERLRPITDTIPKPMAKINGIPFLNYLLQSIRQVGISRILLLVGYCHDVIIGHCNQMPAQKLKIQYSIGSVEDQTGRRLINAYDVLDDHFLLLYGDNFWPIEFEAMTKHYIRKKALVSTTVFSNVQGTGEYGAHNNIEVGEDCFVNRYDKKRQSAGLNGVDIGYFIVDKKILDPTLPGNISFEENVLPGLVARRQLVAYVTEKQYYYITDIRSLNNFERVVRGQAIRPL